jgi:hypothetical protein
LAAVAASASTARCARSLSQASTTNHRRLRRRAHAKSWLDGDTARAPCQAVFPLQKIRLVPNHRHNSALWRVPFHGRHQAQADHHLPSSTNQPLVHLPREKGVPSLNTSTSLPCPAPYRSANRKRAQSHERPPAICPPTAAGPAALSSLASAAATMANPTR